MSNKIYEMVTEQVVKLLEEGTVPWRQPWSADSAPRSIRGHLYRGVNVFLLRTVALSKGYASPYWVTYKQAASMGGQVRKGEKSTLVIFWKWLDREVKQDDGTVKTERVPMLRYYRVFNTDQCDGLTVPTPRHVTRHEHEPVEAAEQIIAGYLNPPKIVETGDAAYYEPGKDRVTLPPRETFRSVESFYSAAFHELAHSTGHASRLNRPKGHKFGSHEYGREELVAEMGATFLNTEAGIVDQTMEQNAAYLNSWIRTIKEDVKAVVVAAGQAQKAADLILDRTFDGDS